ncbi:ATP-dependent permease PDR15 [Penicillium subrubescens]|uniref:ATP-dependent permease PDR15 n=1 Tax=Penicillium subrubescens TaxID=1316194 RepID=A0A1Q5UKS7_9EURO|nr:ATP-dependent permease PDR15 [Penicillium subrubescens]
MLVDGKMRDESFQCKTGYAQQQDLHLETSTAQEALWFPALLRQPGSVPRAEKLAYVEEVIQLFCMQDDEPTCGLDSQTSWAILDLLAKVSKAGQSILRTIHQPSVMLFQRFDRLLLHTEGVNTVYFGEIGDNSKTHIDYFERNGGNPCSPDANPGEWMLEVIGAAPSSSSEID